MRDNPTQSSPENDGRNDKDRDRATDSDSERSGVGRVSEARDNDEPEDSTEPSGNSNRKADRKMNIRQRWGRTSLPNKLNVVLTAIICLSTLVNVILFAKEVWDQDRQIGQVTAAISTGSASTKDAVVAALKQANADLKNSLTESREAFRESLNNSRNQADTALKATLAQGQKALDANIAASRREQRAWIVVTSQTETVTLNDGMPVSVPMKMTNMGKTPAKGIEIHGVVDVVKPESSLDFSYEASRHHQIGLVNVLHPNIPDVSPYFAFERGTPKATRMIVTPELRRSFAAGEVLVVIHGRIDYLDIFGVKHWLKFCVYAGNPDPSSEQCSGYNDMDQEK